jgi:hypothetical protein
VQQVHGHSTWFWISGTGWRLKCFDLELSFLILLLCLEISSVCTQERVSLSQAIYWYVLKYIMSHVFWLSLYT